MYGYCCDKEGCTVEGVERYEAVLPDRDSGFDLSFGVKIYEHMHATDAYGNRRREAGCWWREVSLSERRAAGSGG
jgi:hypothetical protein